MNHHPFAFATFYGLAVRLLSVRLHCLAQRQVINIPSNGNLRGRLVALCSRVQFIGINRQRPREARIVWLRVQMYHGQNPPLSGELDTFQ